MRKLGAAGPPDGIAESAGGARTARERTRAALRTAGGDVPAAAQLLGCSRQNIWEMAGRDVTIWALCAAGPRMRGGASAALLRPPLVTSGPELRALRLRLQLSQAAFARTLGVGASTLKRHEAETELPRIVRLAVEAIAARAVAARLKASTAAAPCAP